MKNKIRFGYEIGTGKEVNINLAHTVITGLTQEAGKTTAIMGLIKRSGLKALIIKTKIGEKAISEGAVIPPFYREDFDWEYASEILEASRKEKLKFERSWIIKYSKGANSLIEFKKNIDEALVGKIRELERSVLITLQAYLEKILPELSYAPLSKSLDLREGINIMDLERFKEETQGLIIKSVLNEVLERDKKTIIILPEAWKYIPEKYSSVVKRPAEAFVRQGATNDNYLWSDSQDITGVSKVILKQVSNWILGRQNEINEIKRSLDQIPLNKKNKPKPEDIATLKLGEFIVVTSESISKCYAQPSWLDDATAKKVAMGKMNVDDIEQPTHIAPYQIVAKDQPVSPGVTQANVVDSTKKVNELRDDFMSNRNDFFNKFEQINETIQSIQTELFNIKQTAPKIDEDEIVARVLQKIPTPSINSSNNNLGAVDEEALINKIIARVPSGAKVYKIAPVEKIKKDFLEEAKNKILADVSSLNDKEKKMFKHVEAQGKEIKSAEIITKVWLIKEGGSARTQISQSWKSLNERELMKKGTHGGYMPNLKPRLTSMLGVHGATEQEVQQVFDHILMEMLK